MRLSCIWKKGRECVTKTVRIENLADAVTAELVNYQQEVTDDLKKEIRTVSRETVQQIKNTSPKESGRYAKGWKFRVIFENENDLRVRIYNAQKPQLTRLLEYGHAKRGGGRVNGKPHIRPAEQEAARKLLQRVKVIVR